MNKNIKKTTMLGQQMAAGMGRLKTVFGGFLAVMGVREMARAADSFQLIKDRITALWGEGVNTSEVFEKIAGVARETKAPIETLADGFARISISSKGMGMSVDDTLNLVKSLRQQLRISGASVAEVNSVFLQFSQAMGLGRIQGQELRAIMLGNAKGAELLAKIFKTTKGELREFGEKGLLTAEKAARGMIEALPELNKQAAKLRITFGQAAILIFDSFRQKIDELNESFKASKNFGKFAENVAENMGEILRVGVAIISYGVFSKIAAGLTLVYNTLKTIFVGGKVAALFGPQGIIVGILAAIGYTASVLFQQKETLTNGLKLEKLQEAQLKLIKRQKLLKEKIKKGEKSEAGDPFKLQLKRTEAALAMNRKFVKSQEKIFKAEQLRTKKKVEITKAASGKFAALNEEYRKGNLTIGNYINKLKEMDKLDLSEKYKENTISAVDYEKQLISINDKYDKMLEKLGALKNSEGVFDGIKKGAEDTVKSIGTVAEQVAGVTTKAFSHLEDNLVDFVKKGKFEFRQFAQAIMDDITRMVIRMSIIKPLAGAIVGGFGGGASAGETSAYNSPNTQQMMAAKGAAFSGGNVIPFASGGIIGSPTAFGMSGGRTGIMGEDGPEAIMPLSRGPNGKLGITGSAAVVNVINNSDSSETETKRSKGADGSEQIDVYIVNKVSEAIGGGRFDRPFQQTYGLNRKGQ